MRISETLLSKYLYCTVMSCFYGYLPCSLESLVLVGTSWSCTRMSSVQSILFLMCLLRSSGFLFQPNSLKVISNHSVFGFKSSVLLNMFLLLITKSCLAQFFHSYQSVFCSMLCQGLHILVSDHSVQTNPFPMWSVSCCALPNQPLS